MSKHKSEIKNEEIDKKSEELEEALKKAEENMNGWKRAQADYANLKVETEKKIKEIGEYANIQLIMELIPICTYFEQAALHVPEEMKKSEWTQGILNIYKQLTSVMEGLGLKRIETVGHKFDPTLHDAVSHEDADGIEAEMITQEVQPGYTYKKSTLVAAKVKVAK